MTISPAELQALHEAYDSAVDAQKACRAAAEALSAATGRLDRVRVTVVVPCASCGGTVPVTVAVRSKTVPMRDVCSTCRAST
jgi:hypothetical protein